MWVKAIKNAWAQLYAAAQQQQTSSAGYYIDESLPPAMRDYAEKLLRRHAQMEVSGLLLLMMMALHRSLV